MCVNTIINTRAAFVVCAVVTRLSCAAVFARRNDSHIRKNVRTFASPTVFSYYTCVLYVEVQMRRSVLVFCT